MSKESYDTLLKEILAVPDDAIKKPNMPIATFIQEASDLSLWIKGDLTQLAAAGVDPLIGETLSLRTEALIHAQSICGTAMLSADKSYQQYQLERAKAEALKDELIKAFRFAYSSRPDLLRQVKSKRGRGSIETLIQDLHNLSILGKANPEMLTTIGFDLQQLEVATSSSVQLSQLLATVKKSKASKANNHAIRNKAYTLLKTTVENLRLAGRYVFHDQPDKLKGYKSRYWASK